MKRAPVSVVIPSYNSAAYVADAIESVLAQTLPAAEIIVIDDGSTDETAALLRRYRGRIRSIHQENGGVSAARNRGVHAANGDFIAFLDADDIWHPSKLEFQMQAFNRIPSLGLLGTRYVVLPAPFPRIEEMPSDLYQFIHWQQLTVRNYLCASSVIARSSIVNIAGEFDTDLQGPEDRDLWLRIAEFSTAVNLNLALVGYRIVPGSVSRQPERCISSLKRIIAKLDQRQAWRGRWLLRRKALSYIEHEAADLHRCAGNVRRAIGHSLRSFAMYPFPYRPSETEVSLERLKRLGSILLRLMHVRPPYPRLDPNSATTGAARNQLLPHVHST